MSDMSNSSARDVTGLRRNPGVGMDAIGSCDRCGVKAASRAKAGRYQRACKSCRELLAAKAAARIQETSIA